MAGQIYQGTMKNGPKFPQLWTLYQFMTTGQTANETGTPYTWVHKSIPKHFPTHSVGEREWGWMSVVCAHTWVHKKSVPFRTRARWRWARRLLLNPKKNQCKKQTAHLRLLLDMIWVFACDPEMKNQSSMACQHVTKKEKAAGHKI